MFEVAGGRITAAGLPFRYRPPGDMQQISQSGLSQADACPKRQHRLTEGIIAFAISESVHRRPPFPVTLQSDPCGAPGSDTSVFLLWIIHYPLGKKREL